MTFNKECAAYCIDLIRAVMQEKEIPAIPEGITLDQLYGFARLHNVEALMYYGLCQLDVDFSDPIWMQWENRASMLLAQGIVQLSERDMVFDALTAAGIPLLPFKGCWMKELYPNMEYRQMADLDMLIPRDRTVEARQIMQSLGFENESFEDGPHHAGYLKPPYTEVELHVTMMEEDIPYYHNVWDRVIPVEGYPCLYRFTTEDEYVFYIVHLNKHLEDAGTGIRSILDSVVYREAFPDMDREYLRQELTKLNLWQRTLDIETIADCWFQTGEPVPEELASMAEFMITAGSYGKLENRSRQRLARMEQKYKNPIIRGIVYWCWQFFKPLKIMQQSYPVLNKLPILLPVFWVYRAVMKFVRDPKKNLRHIALVFGGGKEHD